LAAIVEYDAPAGFSDPVKGQEQAPTIIQKLKDAGVTTVIAFTDPLMTVNLTNQATRQNWMPEWEVSGYQYQDADIFGRLYDQVQWRHAFGLGIVPPLEEGAPCKSPSFYHRLYCWYYGGAAPAYLDYGFMTLGRLVTGLQRAGPNLTPVTFRDALFSLPPLGGPSCNCVITPQYAFGNRAFPWSDWVDADDVSLLYWDPNTAGATNDGVVTASAPGKYRYVLGAKRFVPGTLPGGDVPFFDSAKSIASFKGTPPSDQPKDYPCTGCPSQK
jgi:hypothetical protein